MANGNLPQQQLLNTLFAQRLGYMNRLQDYARADEDRRLMRERELAQSVGQGIDQASKLALMQKEEAMKEATSRGRSVSIIQGMGGEVPAFKAPEGAREQDAMLTGSLSGASDLAEMQAKFEQMQSMEKIKSSGREGLLGTKLAAESGVRSALEKQRLASAKLSGKRGAFLENVVTPYIKAKTTKEQSLARMAAAEVSFQLKNGGWKPADAAKLAAATLMSFNVVNPQLAEEIAQRSIKALSVTGLEGEEEASGDTLGPREDGLSSAQEEALRKLLEE